MRYVFRYRYLQSCSGVFYFPESDPPHKIMRFWIYYSIWLGFSDLTESVRWKSFVLAVFQFRKGISAGPALKYFTRFIGAGGNRKCVSSISKYENMRANMKTYTHECFAERRGVHLQDEHKYANTQHVSQHQIETFFFFNKSLFF